jgi:hypothetical protein
MSLAYTCDYCGQPIDDDELFAAIEARGHFPSEHDISDGRYQSDALGHYHTEARGDEPACYQRVRDALDLVREFAPMLAALPTTDELAERRDAAARLPRHGGALGRPRRRQEIVRGPGGIAGLQLPYGVRMQLFDAEILTIAEVQRRVADGSISDVHGLGPSRLKALRAALERWERERHTVAS